MKHYFTRLEESIKTNWERPALGNYRGELFTFGELADMIAGGAMLGGMPIANIFCNRNVSQPEVSAEMLLRELRRGDTLLVKASRGAAAERVLRYLEEHRERLCVQDKNINGVF